MPYPESCPECGSTFRNTGTHFTARRNEVGRHVLLELGCQNTTRRFWWDFTNGSPTEEGRPGTTRRATLAETVSAGSASNGSLHAESGNGSLHDGNNGHGTVSTLELRNETDATPTLDVPEHVDAPSATPDLSTAAELSRVEDQPAEGIETQAVEPEVATAPDWEPQFVALPGASGSFKDAFVRQLQIDRLTLRQMRSWLMSDEARRAIEVAAGATEATYERLALILFGAELPHLLGKQSAAPQSPGMSAEERLELQREKARIRARLRRAAAKAARA